MKKFFIAIVFALMSISANAQLFYKDGSYESSKFIGNDFNKGITAHIETSIVSIWRIEFKLGEYVFFGDTPKKYGESRPDMCGGKMTAQYDDDELWSFIAKNKAKIEKKFGVKIVEIKRPYITIYDAEDYQRQIEGEKLAEQNTEVEKANRLKSLNI